jgi:2-keto-4-pentenoate hydratase
MEPQACAEASQLLVRCWDRREVIPALPEPLRPATRLEGYAVQAQLTAQGQPLFGWKVAASSEAGQRHINVDGPLAGRILAAQVRPDGATIDIRGNRMRVADVEFAFPMRGDLPPRARPYEMAEVLAAVESLHPAIEIPDSRYLEFAEVGAAQLIADAACADLFVPGPATTASWREIDLSQHPATATCRGVLLAASARMCWAIRASR